MLTSTLTRLSNLESPQATNPHRFATASPFSIGQIENGKDSSRISGSQTPVGPNPVARNSKQISVLRTHGAKLRLCFQSFENSVLYPLSYPVFISICVILAVAVLSGAQVVGVLYYSDHDSGLTSKIVAAGHI
eukprot:828696-Rhodomonas_salina.1